MADVQEQQAEGQQVEEGSQDQFAQADAAADPNTDAAEPPSIEELASEQGWVPREKFKGPETEWKPAHEFIRAGKDIQKALKRDVEGLRGQMDTVAKTSAAILAERLAEQRAELSQQYAAAVDAGDPDRAWAASQAIARVDATAVQPRPGPAAETVDWAQKNQRILSDPLAARRAVQLCEPYAQANWSQDQQLKAIEPMLKREFPHLFDAPDKGPAGVNEPSTRMNGTQKRGQTAADLPKEARAIAEDLVDRGLIKDKEMYARNYFAAQAKGK